METVDIVEIVKTVKIVKIDKIVKIVKIIQIIQTVKITQIVSTTQKNKRATKIVLYYLAEEKSAYVTKRAQCYCNGIIF